MIVTIVPKNAKVFRTIDYDNITQTRFIPPEGPYQYLKLIDATDTTTFISVDVLEQVICRSSNDD